MWKRKKTQWSKRDKRDEFIRGKLVKKGYNYKPTSKAISIATYYRYQFSNYEKNMIGVHSLEEMIRFLVTFRQFYNSKWYKLSLKVALQKVKGTKFDNHNVTMSRIETIEDVEQSINALLATSRIKMTAQEFILEALNYSFK